MNLTFNEFCHILCDGLYDPNFPLDQQCNGYTMLKKMVAENITPASLAEIQRWEQSPTVEELLSIPDIKFLRFLHPTLRPYIITNWETIKSLSLGYEL